VKKDHGPYRHSQNHLGIGSVTTETIIDTSNRSWFTLTIMVKSMSKMKYSRKKAVKKIAFITAWLVEVPEAYKNKTNVDIEKEILEESSLIPYVARIEKVTVLDCR